MNALVDDCFVHDRDRLRHADALAIIKERLTCATGVERVTVSEADGRILAADVIAPRPIPAHRNAAVDGFAYRYSDASAPLPIRQRIAAGDAPSNLSPVSAARIFTGAPMPHDADTVAMQEDCTVRGDTVDLPRIKRGANVREAGEDIRSGTVVARVGTRLSPPHLAIIAATGRNHLDVRKRLRVAVASTGAELLTPGSEFRAGAVYDSNGPMLRSMIERAGHRTVPLGIMPDRPDVVQANLRDAVGRVDVVITSGGASKGDEDHLLDAIDTLGTRHLWQLAVKPGRPMMMGQIKGVPIVGLPGNPVAALVCALLYVRPLLDRLGGASWREPNAYLLPAGFSIQSKPDRREFLRGWVETGVESSIVRKFQRDGSGLISGLVAATGLIEISEETEHVEEGDLVRFLPFAELGLTV